MATNQVPAVAGVMVMCAMLTGCAVPLEEKLPRFDRSTGWLGADGASTVELNDGRVLWLFGDTFVGSMKPDGGCAEGTKMVNNTIALQSLPRLRVPGSMTFHWGAAADGAAAAWALSPVAIGDKSANHWMWPAGGGVLTGFGTEERLVLFFMMMRRRDKSESVWNFQQHGTATVAVLNPRDPPAQWRTEAVPLRDYEGEIDAGQPVRLISWGPVAMDSSKLGGGVLIYGVDVTDVKRKRLVLARAPHDSLTRFETWEFRTAAGWSVKEEDAVAIADGLVDEFSVTPDRREGRERWMLTQMEPDLGPRILVRFADRPEGPWSDGVAVFTCPEPAQDARSFVYSAKAHPEISSADEVVITYCVNSTDFWYVASHVAHYRPRIVRMPWATLNETTGKAPMLGASAAD